jgi:hypothetical protein
LHTPPNPPSTLHSWRPSIPPPNVGPTTFIFSNASPVLPQPDVCQPDRGRCPSGGGAPGRPPSTSSTWVALEREHRRRLRRHRAGGACAWGHGARDRRPQAPVRLHTRGRLPRGSATTALPPRKQARVMTGLL